MGDFGQQRDRSRFDIFLCCHSAYFPRLRRLLPLLRPHGTVHLASSFLARREIEAVREACDFVHEPRHADDGYENFNLFCVRDINRLARAPHFIKIDCDVELRDDWIAYVEEVMERRPEAVLFGSHAGTNPVAYHLSGPLVRRRLGADVRVRGALKVNGSFYVGQTAFFKAHDRSMQVLHDLVYGFRGGRRSRPSHLPDDGLEAALGGGSLLSLRGTCRDREGLCREDEARSLTVHAVGAGRALCVEDSRGRVRLHDKLRPPPRLKLASKWVRRQLGFPATRAG